MLTAVPLFCSMSVICIIYKIWPHTINLCSLNYLVESSQSWWVIVFLISYAYSCVFILQYERHLYYLQDMAPYDEPLRSELLGGKFTILVGGSVSHLVEVCLVFMWCVYK